MRSAAHEQTHGQADACVYASFPRVVPNARETTDRDVLRSFVVDRGACP